MNGRRPPSVLVVEDDRVIAGSIGAHLRHAGMSVECVEDGDRALRKARFERPECAVFEHARVRHASAALLRSPQATPADIGRIRAVQEAALHIRHIERAVAADGWRGDPVSYTHLTLPTNREV